MSDQNQAIKIAIEDPKDTASKNVRTFYYKENEATISYVAIGPDGNETTTAGSVDPTSEDVMVITGKATGSTPTAADGFKFVGWYKDKDCTQPVDEKWVTNNKLTPGKTVKYGDKDGYASATYYAKFEYDVADLTITKHGCQDIDENQSFIFDVTGPDFSKRVVINGNDSVTIKGLKVGEYTVTEVTDWSWRYKPENNVSAQKIELKPRGVGENKVTFTNARTKDKWLGGDAYEQNKFGISASASTN